MDRRLHEFMINRSDKNVTEGDLRSAIEEELEGPGKLLGYRAMANKIRQVHQLKVPRRLVNAMMCDIDPEGLEGSSLKNKRRRGKRGRYVSCGRSWAFSLDGHTKLTGYQ